MKKVCAWCKCDMGEVAGEISGQDAGMVSHGLCNTCGSELFAQMGVQLHEYLDAIGAPIAVVNDRGLVQTVNAQARTLLGKELPEVEEQPGGIVFDCIHASKPGGCGNTVHCSGCTIRRTVMDTFQTGCGHMGVTTCLMRQKRDGRQTQAKMVITTEKVANVVLLRIDSMENA